MKLLLDTHIFLWAFLEPKRLGPRLREALVKGDTEIYLSSITIWECLVLSDKGRIQLQPTPEEWLAQRLNKLRPHVAVLNFAVAMKSRSIELEHDDPADRFLAATAAVYDLYLATADKRIIRGKGFPCFPNR
jgi:PIN domain nuclease of toxin-antitoxin system